MVLTGVAVALLDLNVTNGSSVSRIALTGESGDPVSTHAIVAWWGDAVIYVLLTEQTSEPWNEV